ncbi:MAG TPA: DUF5682 family protein [Acidobacteriota bacterium]|nr:DUF5682 family protein [Acidobacteriota bacterium]
MDQLPDFAFDPTRMVDELAGSQTPLLIGVRHHSPACAAAIPTLLDAFGPDKVVIELPTEFQDWIKWLGHKDLLAPVALAGVRSDGNGLAFYPFADFSPELAAIRWAIRQNIPVEAFDLPMEQWERLERVLREADPQTEVDHTEPVPSLLQQLLAQTNVEESESLWDVLVESHATASDPEAIRRAALLYGWALRVESIRSKTVRNHDLHRERFMRECLFKSGLNCFGSSAGAGEAVQPMPRIAAVIGAFHAPALLQHPWYWSPTEPAAKPAEKKKPSRATTINTSLIAYSHELLDSRSGYPAGIRDPLWQHRVWEAASTGRTLSTVVTESVVGICAEIRRKFHVASVPDAMEAVRMTEDLATLRGIPSPGRRELLEAIETALGQGELLGRGRILAQAMERVLVGRRRGRLPGGTPRSGLGPHVEQLLTELKLPGPGTESSEAKRMRLDPLRSDLDARRQIAFKRLGACGVPYAKLEAGEAIGASELLTQVWTVSWTPGTEAMLELVGVRGVTLEQATLGSLKAEEARYRSDDKWVPAVHLYLLGQAADCALHELTHDYLTALTQTFATEATLPQLIAAIELVLRIEHEHIPGLSFQNQKLIVDFDYIRAELFSAALKAIEGLAGSKTLDDARALLELIQLFERQSEDPNSVGDGRLLWALNELAENGSSLMQGAAGALRVRLGVTAGAEFGRLVASWVDAATSKDTHQTLAERLQGTLAVAAPLFEADPTWATPLMERIEQQTDTEFLHRLPALREGFEVLSTASRARMLTILAERLEDDGITQTFDIVLNDNPHLLARCAEIDRTGRQAVESLFGQLPTVSAGNQRATDQALHKSPASGPDCAISPRDRWRLILGHERERMKPKSAGIARALDELYGAGHGEGSRGEIAGGKGGGKEAPFPSTREWAEELEALFGGTIREEVLGRAVERGRTSALLELDAETVSPSIELLEQVLSLKGGLSEGQLGHLRRIVQRVIDALVKELATRIRPALTGLTVPLPTRKPGGPLDIRRTITANLKTLRQDEAGNVTFLPERLLFKTRTKRSMDWRIVLVVDISGSMEASVIYSAMMAAILSGLPAVSVHFVAFNTEILDLTHRVEDPLGLLLEVSVGGGTHIARGLRYARELLTVPSRSLVILVTDFEEGWPVAGLVEEVRALVETGAKTIGLAALDDSGQPRYSKSIAELVVGAGMSVAALTPLELARWVGEKIRG